MLNIILIIIIIFFLYFKLIDKILRKKNNRNKFLNLIDNNDNITINRITEKLMFYNLISDLVMSKI